MNQRQRPEADIYIGVGCGFVAILAVMLIIGIPLRDVAIWVVVFLVLGFLIAQIIKRLQNRRP